jgi:WD40 repeat protein
MHVMEFRGHRGDWARRFVIAASALLGLSYASIGCGQPAEAKPLAVLQLNDEVQCAAFSPDGSLLGLGVDDGSVALLETKYWKLTETFQAHKRGTDNLALLDERGESLITGGSDGYIRYWDRKRKMKKEVEINAWGFSLSPSHGHLAIADLSNKVPVYFTGMSMQKGVAKKTFGDLWKIIQGHKATRCQFDRDGKLLATGGLDNNVCLWDLASGTKTAQFESEKDNSFNFDIFSMAFSPDNKLIASGSSDAVCRVWEIKQKKRIATWKKAGSGGITCVAFLDNKNVATATYDGVLRCWRVGKQEAIAEIRAHAQLIWRVAISPDGRYLVTTSEDKTAKVWAVQDLIKGR